MAIVTLADVWVHQVSDLSSFVQVYAGSISERSGISGEVRRYANGVTRAITTLGTTRTVKVDLPFVSRADIDLMETWVATPVMVRDPLGRKTFGMFFSVDIEDRPIGDPTSILSASFELSELSITEEV